MAVKHIRGSEIASVTSPEGKLALVDFSAVWCAPCKMLDPVLKKVSDELGDKVDFFHVDVDESPEASSRFGIRGVPTMVIFHNGQEIDRLVGFRDKNSLKKHLENLVDSKLA